MKRTLSLIPLLAAAAPAVALAAPRTWSELVGALVTIMNSGVAILVSLAIVFYFYGVTSNILKFENDPERRKAYFFWGLIALVVMVSVWGILRILENTLFGAGAIQ